MQYLQAMEQELKIYGQMLIQQYIKAREITVSVLQNRSDYEILPILELRPKNEFYDYEAKYTPGGSAHVIPARIPPASAARVEEISRQIYTTFKCLGFSRIDFIIDPSGDPYVLEVNSIPGMTSLSLFPDAAAYSGMSYDELVDTIVKLALEFWKAD